MIQGSSPHVAVQFRVLLVALILPLMVVLGGLLLGIGGARATQVVAHQPLTLYGGPSDAFSALATIATGAKVEILWCNAEATWCLVQNSGAEGWVPRGDLVTKNASSAEPSAGTGASSAPATADSLVKGGDAPAASVVGPSTSAEGSVETSSAGSVHVGASVGGVSVGVTVH
jgi:uncharacterized protein YgiM (DUF1202 family)